MYTRYIVDICSFLLNLIGIYLPKFQLDVPAILKVRMVGASSLYKRRNISSNQVKEKGTCTVIVFSLIVLS